MLEIDGFLITSDLQYQRISGAVSNEKGIGHSE